MATSIFCSSVAAPQRGQQWRHECGANASFAVDRRPKAPPTAHHPQTHKKRTTHLSCRTAKSKQLLPGGQQNEKCPQVRK